MKRITKSVIAVFAITTTLVSCSKDDKPTTASASMEGKWTIDNTVITSPNSAPQTLDIDGDCPDKAYLLLNGTSFEEQDINTETCEAVKLSGTWKKTNDKLEIATPNGGKATLNIVTVTDKQLVLEVTNLNGFPSGTSAKFYYVK